MNFFPLQVLKIDEVIFSGEALSLQAPGSLGELTVLAQHETILTSLRQGELIIKPKKGDEIRIEIEQGFLEADRNKVTVLL
ncbi:MAG: hypothetical protein ACKKL4_00790 [Patescibacteria group bacterium]